MNIRPFHAGDEFHQLIIYNTAGAGLSKFKPATIVDIQRRVHAKDFNPTTRWYAEVGGKVVAYCTFQTNGRIGYPWCMSGFESAAAPLFTQTLQAMKQRGIRKAFSAYRNDWPAINEFFEKNGFHRAREMVNYVLTFENMPTPSARLGSAVGPARIEDIPAIYAMDPTVFRVANADELKAAIWNNPWYGPEAIFVLRGRDDVPLAAGVFITNAQYADPRQVDSNMPCFRLGAFGAEGMTAKRIRGFFSFVTAPDRNIFPIGMDLLSHASNLLTDDDEIACYAAQVASDASALHSFYQRVFEKQGSFPVYERNLD